MRVDPNFLFENKDILQHITERKLRTQGADTNAMLATIDGLNSSLDSASVLNGMEPA